ncbi:unnamed protein product [Symbiodinium sp. CCMP2456]|nr:unnamed protein product [Symbiodinium sp. CCMP2456]
MFRVWQRSFCLSSATLFVIVCFPFRILMQDGNLPIPVNILHGPSNAASRASTLLHMQQPEAIPKREVLIYTHAKVGSVSLTIGFKNAGVGAAHAHTLEAARQWLAGNSVRGIFQSRDRWADEELALYAGEECFIVTAVRSGFEFYPSGYFQSMFNHTIPWGYRPHGPKTRYHDSPNASTSDWTVGIVQRMGEENITALIADFKAQLPIVIRHWMKIWFREHFYPATEVDVFQRHFDFESKHMFFERGTRRCSVLLLRHEDIDNWDGILQQFFPGFRLPRENIGRHKWYASVYARFKEAMTYTEAEVEQICTTDIQRHFYTTPQCAKSARHDLQS